MLEHIPEGLGEAMRDIRPGLERLVWADPALVDVPDTIRLTSSAFQDGAPLPVRFTDDGPGVSPPLAWDAIPDTAAELLLIVEDADPPLLSPLVHAIVHRLTPAAGFLTEGGMSVDDPGIHIGRNSYLRTGWLAPDPPKGHGPHRYVFQLYALGAPSELGEHPGRSAVRDVVEALAIARGRLIGTYERT
ncbi:YbhB/YbcL family Raf kinase inhibitor-like protein [Sphingomonas montana]|uniref:YbhB/YbcL family Raf kinase inhibitor-like protein n=1 Tax=Sphingomonas montana TaxID=1843236 RepID=UPI00096F4899|nr:YbhB/YbcL family Raf kinase inhibitor-like protein [Sphingomonas montana]